MADNVVRTKGRGQGYKFDRGGNPTEFGPFIGTVKNNIDPTRSGRLQVFIEQFAGENPDDESLWRTVSYIPPFYGLTPNVGSGQGAGAFVGNQQSYGMWFTPPDLGTQVICFFVEGDPNQGYYMGCIPQPGISHMLPAIGAATNYSLDPGSPAGYFSAAKQLPVTEINTGNQAIADDPRFFDQSKPVHSVVAGIMLQQGLITDPVRGPITSNSQRESPSSVFGISTPGRPVYQGGLSEQDIKAKLDGGQLRPQDVQVIGRRGGHSIVLDDGNLEGKDNLVRIRTSKGHQITMSDDEDCFYFIHANGQTWLEFGRQGTVDVYSTNSVNVRSQGTINFHSDGDVNICAGGTINLKGTVVKMQGDAKVDIMSEGPVVAYSKTFLGLRSNGSLFMKSVSGGGWDGGSSLSFKAGCISLNSGGAGSVPTPQLLKDFKLADTKFVENRGWVVEQGKLSTIVTRAPTHEPYPYHNQGTANLTQLSDAPVGDTSEQLAGVLSSISDVVPDGKIDISSYLTEPAAALTVGSLSTNQVTGLLAQAAQLTGQGSNVVSAVTGIGKYGISPQALEATGFLKPGTVQNLIAQAPSQLTDILSSPSVWTGQSGVQTLSGFLSNTVLQGNAQQEIMLGALDKLRSAGVVTGDENPANLAAVVQNATKYGTDAAIEWAKGKAPPELQTAMNSVARGAQYAVDFVNSKVSEVTTGARIGGFQGTVQRTAVDAAVADVINNAKIPVPNFSTSLIYANVPNDELTYSGDDPLVLARINDERRRRGLPPISLA